MNLVILIHTLIIIILSLLFFSHIFNYLKFNEGLTNKTNTYQGYDDLENKDPLFLAIKNAANISYLKSQLDEINGLKQQIYDMSNNIIIHTTQIDQIQQSMLQTANDITGGGANNKELPITDDDNEENNENNENTE